MRRANSYSSFRRHACAACDYAAVFIQYMLLITGHNAVHGSSQIVVVFFTVIVNSSWKLKYSFLVRMMVSHVTDHMANSCMDEGE